MSPFEEAAKEVICLKSQVRAAPIPRVGLVVSEAVWRVPKLTSVWIVAWMRAGSICDSRERVSASVVCGTSGIPTLEGGHVCAPQFANSLLSNVGEYWVFA